jgi:uncharacterized protein YcbK (DUF882 family)
MPPRPSLSTVLLAGAFAVALTTPNVSHAKPRTHRVYAGQTLGMIAKRYNVSVEALRNANGLRVGRPIQPKQELIIPDRDDEDGSQARELHEDKRRGEDRSGQATAQDGDHRAPETAPMAVRKAAPSSPDYARKPRRPGYVVLVGTTGRWQGQALTPKGKITGPARKGFEKVLASWRTGSRETIDEQLIRLLVRVSDHFGGRPVRVVSGYRPWSASQYTPHSRHNLGQAVDFSVPGVPNSVVRDYCRSLGKVGVGYYPNSSFVHLDVRETKTYWVDYSGPGEAPRYADSRGRDPALSSSTIPASISRPIGGHDSPTSGSVDTQARPTRPAIDLQ